MPTTQKAYLDTETGDRLPCLFNPSTLTVALSNVWRGDETPGKSAPDLYFAGSSSGTFDTELVFDTTDTGKPVTDYTSKLVNVMRINPALPGHDPNRNRGRPPWIRFHWGDLHSFKSVVERLQLTFTYFGANGTPLRARASITLRQYEDDPNWAPQNPTSGTPHPHRVHVVQRGDTLDRLAARYYGDPTNWRIIAEDNHVEDPFRLAPGLSLRIPAHHSGAPSKPPRVRLDPPPPIRSNASVQPPSRPPHAVDATAARPPANTAANKAAAPQPANKPANEPGDKPANHQADQPAAPEPVAT
jgi:LysM repeat protein